MRYLLLAILIFIISCSDSKVEHKKIDYKPLIKLVKKNSFSTKIHFNLDSLNVKLIPIDTAIIKEYFEGLPVSNIKDYKFEYDAYSRYYYFDCAIIDDLTFFSILHNDEVGYNNLFHFIFDSKKEKLISVDLIGQTGGDGGHGQIDIFDYNSRKDKLKVTTISTMDEDLETGVYQETTDSIVTKYDFDKSGTKVTNVINVTSIDTILRE